jgi:hypothetical protein
MPNDNIHPNDGWEEVNQPNPEVPNWNQHPGDPYFFGEEKLKKQNQKIKIKANQIKVNSSVIALTTDKFSSSLVKGNIYQVYDVLHIRQNKIILELKSKDSDTIITTDIKNVKLYEENNKV